jgi:hypothetical protein
MIRRFSGLAALLVLMGLSLGGPAQGQKALPGPEVESDKLSPGSFVGTLKGAVLPGSDFQLEIPISHLELKPGANLGNNRQAQQLQRDLQQIVQAQTRLAQAKNPQQQAQALAQLQRAALNVQQIAAQSNQQLLNALRVVTNNVVVDFHASDDLVVRTMILPGGAYDEKGNPKPPPTGDELKALKGDKPNLPGYVAKPDDLKAGEVVVVTLKRAPAPKADPPMKDAPPADPKDPKDPKAAPMGPKNIATMILIEKDAPETTSPGNKKKN